MLKTIKKLIWCFIYLVLFFVGVFMGLIWGSLYQDTASRKFERELSRELNIKKSISSAEVPLESQWRTVCVVHDYNDTLDVLQKAGYAQTEQLEFVVGKPFKHIEEGRWQLVFVTADNEAYAFYMQRLRVDPDALCGKYETTIFKSEEENTLSLVFKVN